ncbi:MAG: hypothetical protein WA830_24985 [Candidatus Sulfotelmatobacter sp.]
MRRTSLLLLCLCAVVSVARAQVLSPNEIKDPQLSALQERNMDDLKQLGAAILALPTDYPFYLSRKLDLDESKQKWADQRSIQFDRYKDKVVLKITGNYFAAYSAEKMNSDQRAKQTFLQIVFPILQAAVARFQKNASVQAYAFEISHHVLGKVDGVALERPENLVVIVPRAGAIDLVNAKDDTARQAALMRGEVFVNAKPATIWLGGEGPPIAQDAPPDDPSTAASGVELVHNGEQDIDKLPSPVHVPTLKPAKPADPPKPPRDTSPQALSAMQSAIKPILDAMVKELDPQAHFVAYASPSFIAFRNGVYLELSINTTVPEPSTVSRYRLAALAFDDHVAHLIRPVLGYFKDDLQFDGVGFSSTLHLASKPGATVNSEAVEFFFPFAALRCYERYDCTGQQLLDAGTVLINGERVSLDLQIAEGGGNR